MAAPVPVYVSTNYATGPNQPIPVYVVNSDGGGSDSYTKAESDDKYNTKTAFYNYAGGDDTHPPAAASATYTPTNAFYAYAGGNAGAPPASAPSTYLKITDAPTIYATLVQTQALANDLVNEIANSEDLANKTQTITGSSDQYPSCAAVSTALSGKVSKNDGSANRLSVSSEGINATTALSIKDYGSSKGWGIQTTPANETACQIWRFNDSLGAYRAAMSQAGKNVTIDDFLRISLSGFGSGIDCALSTKPANATDCVVWSLRNNVGTQVATISQSANVGYLTGFSSRKLKIFGYPASDTEGLSFTPSSATACNAIVFNNNSGTQKGSILQMPDGSVRHYCQTIDLTGYTLSTVGPAISIRPGNTTGNYAMSIANNAGTYIGGIWQDGDVVTFETTKIKLKTDSSSVDSFATTLNTSTTAIPRCSAVSAALASYIPTANVEQAVTTSTTNIPSSNAVKTYVDSKVVSTTALSFTVPEQINVGTLLYYSSIPASVFEMVYAFRFDFSDYLLTDRFQMITLISSITEWVNLSMEVEYISANRTANAIAPGRRMYYFSKGAGDTTATVVTDTNAYYTENTTLPYVTIESNSSVANYNHFKLWAHNGSANKGFISMKVTFHFTRINVA